MRSLTKFSLLCISLGAVVWTSDARPDVCDQARFLCNGEPSARSSKAPAYPSTSSHVSLNPGTVPTENTYGIEVLDYQNSFDFSLVKGTGRVGASVSPSNGEETFFGPPAFELDPDYLKRKQDEQKYVSQKFNFAFGALLFDNKRDGASKLQLSIGLAAKYNKLTHNTWPGAGLSAIVGPFTLGISAAQDEVLIDFASFNSVDKQVLRYSTQTASVGVFFQGLALDYSLLWVYPENNPTFETRILTGSLLLKKFILTAAYRTEDSNRPAFDFSKQILIVQQIKNDIFLGAQIAITPRLLVGGFYNYYLLHEISIGLTWFF